MQKETFLNVNSHVPEFSLLRAYDFAPEGPSCTKSAVEKWKLIKIV